MRRQSRALTVCSALVATAALAITSTSSARTPPSRTSSRYVEPSTVSSACGRDAPRQAACEVVQHFFRAVNSRRFTGACELLGTMLRSDTMGLTCQQFVEVGVPEPVPWGILGARRTGRGVVVSISLGQSELDHIRIRHHRAFVGLEDGHLRILWTKLVA